MKGDFIIPAIDILDGKCVRLTGGDFAQKKIYSDSPLEIAKQFENAGLRRLHLVDLDGAKAGSVKNWSVLEQIASNTSLQIDFGGGLKKKTDVEAIFKSGARWATVGSIAVKNESELIKWFDDFGPENFLLGADVRSEKIAISGWLETTEINVYDFIQKYYGFGVQQVFCTDVSKDGKLEGPSFDLYKRIIEKCPGLYFIASGGVSTTEDLVKLKEMGCSAAIVGKAIYEGRISLEELSSYNQ